jgi:hypothetical protein
MKLLDWAKTAALVSVAVFLGFGSYLLWVTTQAEKQLGSQAAAVLSHFESTLSKTDYVIAQTGTAVSGIQTSVAQTQASLSSVASGLNQTIALVNHPCAPGPCGTVADIGKTLNTFRGTAGEIEIAAHHEDSNLGTLDIQETQLFQHTDSVVTGLAKTNTDLDTFISSPDLSSTVRNVNGITYSLGQTSADFQNKFHSFLYPPPCHGIKCDIGKIYTIVKIGSQFAEPAYWADQLVRGALP